MSKKKRVLGIPDMCNYVKPSIRLLIVPINSSPYPYRTTLKTAKKNQQNLKITVGCVY